ncbi:MAG: DUF3750 domain-containing protein [Planctomycetota bacterium]
MVDKTWAWIAPLVLALLPTACATLPSELPRDVGCIVTCKSARLPPWMPWYSQFAEHGWYDVYDGSSWIRIEILGRSTGVRMREIDAEQARSDERFDGREVHVLATYTGEAARAMVPVMIDKAPGFPHANGYEPWPGPNSNTFVEWLSHQVPGLWVEQYGTAVGKDYPINGWVRAGVSTTRTGLELETPYVGVQVGLQEGVELHLVGLTLGIDLWPPQVKLPFLPAFPWQMIR